MAFQCSGGEALDPDEFDIVDAHHHLMEVGRRRHSYVLDDLLADTSTHRVKETIFVECAWPDLESIAETRRVAEWALESSKRGGAVVRGIVGFCDLRVGAAAGEILDRMKIAAEGRLVGIRHSATWDPSPLIRNHRTKPTPGMYCDARFREGFRELANRGLTFDAWVYHPQLHDVVDLARAFPETTIIKDHLGGPLGKGPYEGHADEVTDVWKRHMAELASCPNVYLKIGGIGFDLMMDSTLLPDRPTAEQLAGHWKPRIHWCIERFGADRCMLESNYPADQAACTYATIWDAFKLLVGDASVDEKRKLFGGTARKAYLTRTGT